MVEAYVMASRAHAACTSAMLIRAVIALLEAVQAAFAFRRAAILDWADTREVLIDVTVPCVEINDVLWCVTVD